MQSSRQNVASVVKETDLNGNGMSNIIMQQIKCIPPKLTGGVNKWGICEVMRSQIRAPKEDIIGFSCALFCN